MSKLSLIGTNRHGNLEHVENPTQASVSIDRDLGGRANVEASLGDITAEWHKPNGRIEIIKIGVAQKDNSIEGVKLKLTHIPVFMKIKLPLSGCQ